MYYLLKVDILKTNAPNCVCVESLFSDYYIYVTKKEICSFLGIRMKDLIKLINEVFYIVFDSDNSEYYCFSSSDWKDYGFSLLFPRRSLNCFDLSQRLLKFLFRYVHDCDKAIASVAAVDKFICDLEAGTSPASLWSQYCWYRVFGHLPINFNESDLNNSAAF